MKKVINSPKAPKAIGPYSQAIEVNGMIYISGQLPVDVNTGKFAEGGIQEQTEQSLKNIGYILEAAGCTYDNVVNMINQLDIYESVNLVIPSVVWREMEKQIIEKHDERIVAFKKTIEKIQFPEFSISENLLEEYSVFIKGKIEEYKVELSNGINNVIEMNIATNQRFDSIVDRAFEKKPPFEGKDKKSDKGFKDALLWESIFEFVSSHQEASYVFYTQDCIFKDNEDILTEELLAMFAGVEFKICSAEDVIKNIFELWAKEIDEYSFIPLEDNFDEFSELRMWLDSDSFKEQLSAYSYDFIEETRLIKHSSTVLMEILNISENTSQEDLVSYSIDAILRIGYTIDNQAEIFENVEVCIVAENKFGEVYFIDDIYRNEDGENNG